MISNFLFNFTNFCIVDNFCVTVRAVVLAGLIILRILPLTSFMSSSCTKLVILGISPLTSFILALRVVLVVKFVISGILSSIFFILGSF